MKRLMGLVSILVVLAFCPTFSLAVTEMLPRVRVSIVHFENEQIFTRDFCENMVQALEQEITAHYAVPVEFTLIEENYASYRDQADMQGEEFFANWLSEQGVDLILVNEFSADQAQITYKAYHRDGLLDVYYLPFEATILPSIADISVGRYLNLIEGLDGRLYPTQLY